jgi:hypothetical protein
MANPQLRVYLGPTNSSEPEIASPSEPVRHEMTVALGDILPLLADAVQMQRAWLQDFENDSVTLSADLYEVLMAYQELRQTA